MERLSKGLSGIAGEYFVAAELSRRGFMASVTLRNNEGIDIHASKWDDGKKLLAIQVKSTQKNSRRWPLNKKVEHNESHSFFYIFVLLKNVDERPEYFIVPSNVVAKRVREGHQAWLDTPGKQGQKHNDTDMREFADIGGEFLERWDLLD